jgi:hypothetical protein
VFFVPFVVHLFNSLIIDFKNSTTNKVALLYETPTEALLLEEFPCSLWLDASLAPAVPVYTKKILAVQVCCTISCTKDVGTSGWHENTADG